MAPLRPLCRPAHIPPLSSLLSPGQHPSTGGGTVPLSPSPHLVRPSHVVLILDASSARSAAWTKETSVGKASGDKTTALRAVVLREAQEQGHGALASEGIPTAHIRALSGAPPSFPADSEGKHFVLPKLRLQDALRDQLDAWLEALRIASERQLSVEFVLQGYDPADAQYSGVSDEEHDLLAAAQHEQVEELLSKSFSRDFERWEQRNAQDPESSREGMPGAFLVLDAFGSPPTHLSSGQLLRSKHLQEWSGFCSRLALHPRVFVKLSPPSSCLKSDANSQAGPGGLKAMDKDGRAELRRNVRIWIDALLDALGEERLIFAATGLDASQLPSSATSTTHAESPSGAVDGDAPQHDATLARQKNEKTAREGKEEARLTEVELWFELVREAFADIGIDSQAMSKIFETNALKLYGIAS